MKITEEHKKTLGTLFFIAGCAVNKEKDVYSDAIRYALAQEFKHYDTNYLVKLVINYGKEKNYTRDSVERIVMFIEGVL